VVNDDIAPYQVQFGFIRFRQLTLPEASSILCPGVPDNARAVHTEMISLFSRSGLFASVHFERLQLRKWLKPFFCSNFWSGMLAQFLM
jgi:hypothetical protein